MAYTISRTLFGHSSDVRCLAVSPDGTIISGSRDNTTIVWKNENGNYTHHKTIFGHTNYVSAVCVLPSTSAYAFGLIATGSHDSTIRLYQPDSVEPELIFKGHEGAVTCLSPAFNTCLLSASWDQTAKLWNTSLNECSASFRGHLMGVWSVIQVPSGQVITGSADRVIRVFQPNGKLTKTLEGHSDCVRGLCHISDAIILSCSNDSSVRRWNIDNGECIEVLYNHPNYIYSIACANYGSLIVTGGEDRCVTIFTVSGPQKLIVPAQSVWTVAVLPNFDIVVGSSDGLVRIFTLDDSRMASMEEMIKYDKTIKESNLQNINHVGGIKVAELPGNEVLLEAGKYDGHIKIIRGEKGVMCYKWSEVECKWEEVGDVVGACNSSPPSREKVIYQGKEYDFVFNVDLEDGVPPLKLPYNVCDDPWNTAQTFINVNKLPSDFLEQIANFIISNSTIQSPETPNANNMLLDPFTGTSRHVPYSCPVLTPKVESVKRRMIPHTNYVRFDQGNRTQIRGKLFEFNHNIGDGAHYYDTNVLERVIKLADFDTPVDNADILTLRKLLLWPEDIIFPVLDIARLAVRKAEVNAALCNGESGHVLLNTLLQLIIPGARPANKMLTVRLFANLFCYTAGENLMLQSNSCIISAVQLLVHQNSVKGVQIACATLMLNYSVAFTRKNDLNGQKFCHRVLVEMIPFFEDAEALYRALVALGTLLHASDQPEIPNELYENLVTLTITKSAEKIGECAYEITKMLN